MQKYNLKGEFKNFSLTHLNIVMVKLLAGGKATGLPKHVHLQQFTGMLSITERAKIHGEALFVVDAFKGTFSKS